MQDGLKKAFHHNVINEFHINFPGIQRRISSEELPVLLRMKDGRVNANQPKKEACPGVPAEERTVFLGVVSRHSNIRL